MSYFPLQLKLYLRRLPDGILTTRLYPYFLSAAAASGDARSHFLRALVSSLPPPNAMLCEFLLRHLVKVVAHSDENKMHVQNVSTIFGPLLLRSADSHAMLSDASDVYATTGALVDGVGELFDSRRRIPFCGAGQACLDYAAPDDAVGHMDFSVDQVLFFTEQADAEHWRAVSTDGRSGLVPCALVRVDVRFRDSVDSALSATSPRGAANNADNNNNNSSNTVNSNNSSSDTIEKNSGDVASVVAARLEREALHADLRAAAPGLGVVRSAPSGNIAVSHDEAIEKILALQNAHASDVAERVAAVRIAELQQRRSSELSERRLSMPPLPPSSAAELDRLVSVQFEPSSGAHLCVSVASVLFRGCCRCCCCC